MSTANSDVWKFSTFLLVGLMVGYGFSQFVGTDSFTKQSIVINKGSMTSDNLVDRPHEGTVQ